MPEPLESGLQSFFPFGVHITLKLILLQLYIHQKGRMSQNVLLYLKNILERNNVPIEELKV